MWRPKALGILCECCSGALEKRVERGRHSPLPPYSLSSPCPTLVPHLRERVCIFAGLASASKHPVISACAQMAHLACGSTWAAFLLFNY